MKESNITVTMPIRSFEELKGYKEKYYELKNMIKDCFEKDETNEMDYIFDVMRTLETMKRISGIPMSSNIIIMYDKKQGN